MIFKLLFNATVLNIAIQRGCIDIVKLFFDNENIDINFPNILYFKNY